MAVMGLSGGDLVAQPLPDGYEWVYGCWENPRTGDCYIIGKDGIRENMTRRWVGFCFLKKYPTLDVWGEPLKPYEFSSFQRHLSFVGPFECDTFLCVDNHVLRIPGENGETLVKRQVPPEKARRESEIVPWGNGNWPRRMTLCLRFPHPPSNGKHLAEYMNRPIPSAKKGIS